MNIIGRFYLIFICFLFSLSYSRVYLKISDLNGSSINQVGLGVPFLLKVEIESGANDNIKPEIAGLKNPDINVNYEGTSSTITNVAGQITVERSFRYILRIDKEGSYSLGPAKVYIQGDFLESNILNIKVGSEQILKRSSDKSSAKLSLSVDKNDPFLGQKFQLFINLKAYDQVNISGVSDLQLDDFTVYSVDGPYQKTFYEEDKRVLSYDWIYTLFPKTSGKIVIPSITAFLKIPDHNKDRSLFSSFFTSYKQENVLSNSVVLDVKKLPKGDFGSVGKFSKFQISIDKDSIEEGDAALLKVEFEGDSDFSVLDFDLKDLPNGLKIYKSKSSINEKGKIFEFVVQGLNPGVFKISPQEFIYFDPDLGSVNKLVSDPKQIVVNEKKIQKDLSDLPEEQDLDGIVYLSRPRKGNYGIHFCLSNKIFYFILLFPFIIVLLNFIYSYFINSHIFKIFIFRRRLNDPAKVYETFIDLISLKMGIQRSEVTLKFLKSLINDQSWHIFLDKSLSFKFSDSSLLADNFLADSKKWFSVLEKKL